MKDEREFKMADEKKILDSGARREFASGAVRDIQEGKGRCDLLPLDIVGEYLGEFKPELMEIFLSINSFVRGVTDKRSIYKAINTFCCLTGWTVFDMLLEVSKHYEEGAKKYEERNWEKGIPAHCYVDSGLRHLIKWADEWNDEPHDRAFVWNMMCLLWTIENKPELNDLPYAKARAEADAAEDKEWGTLEERGIH